MKNILLALQIIAFGSMSLLAQPVITQQPTNQIVLNGGNAAFSVSVSGAGPMTYQWRFNGTNFPINILTRVAGNNYYPPGFTGDGYSALFATMTRPSGLALDATGKLYIVDQYNNRVRAVDTNGIINTVAGGGNLGDGVQATNASLSLSISDVPACMAFDSSGNFYIAEAGNHRVRRVDTNGIISTVAGNGIAGFSGDGGLALNAKLNSPTGIAVDKNGNVFIADNINNRIRKVDQNGIITTVAGKGPALGFSGDGGMATNASFSGLYGLAIDGAGNLLIADMGNQRIRKLDVNGVITTLAGNGIPGFSGDNDFATNASLNQPFGVAVDIYNDVYIADYYNNRIRMVSPNGIISTVAGTGDFGYSGDGGSPTNAYLDGPISVGLDAYGNLYFGDDSYAVVRKVDLGRAPFYQLNNVGAANAGNYDVVVSSPYGSVTSSVVSLTVLLPPSITTQPTNTTVTNGNAANLNVVVSGAAPFGYQWFTSPGYSATGVVPVVGGGQIGTVQIISIGGGYMGWMPPPQVHFIGGGGSGAGGYGNVDGSGTVRSVSITNYGYGYTSPPTVVIDPPSTNNQVIPGQTNAALTFSPVAWANGTNYFVVVTNNYGSVTSSFVPLKVLTAPFIVNPPVSITNRVGSTAIFNVDADGTHGALSLFTFRWYKNATNYVGGSSSSFSTSAHFTFPVGSINDAGSYSVVVSNSYGSVTSEVANLTVLLPPQSFSGQNANGGGVQLQFSGTPNYSYILQTATNLTPPVNWQSILTNPADGNGNWSFTVTNLPAPAGYYRAVGQ
jgi:sugar lactone lactonase YvrE